MEQQMALELGKALTFFLSLLSLFPVLLSAFFIPGTNWQQRLALSLIKAVIAGCICFASGLLFTWPSSSNPQSSQPLTSTLPVRLFLWALVSMAILFAASWFLEIYYVPWLWRNLP
jgi:hypothetical protein